MTEDAKLVREKVIDLARRAKSACRNLSALSTEDKNRILSGMADALEEKTDFILAANARDVVQAKEAGLSRPMLKRLSLGGASIQGMAEGLKLIASLPDPIGEVSDMGPRRNGLLIGKMRVPLGVIGIIYESRPNVTADAVGLCLKTSNAVILRGGSEALCSNMAIVDTLYNAAVEYGAPEGAFSLVDSPEREAARALMTLEGYIDLLIPRGSASLIRTVKETATIPVVETGVGNCHVYVHRDADLETGRRIVLNAKVSNPSVCNAAETLLVDQEISRDFLPAVVGDLRKHGVEIRGCPLTCEICPEAVPASEGDWATEYLDLVLAVKVVEDLEAAMAHIEKWGTGHSEAIVTRNYSTAMHFLGQVDAAAVYVNASPRFTDGFEFGLGAEIGISTQRLHARGPMGLKELTTTKYIVMGNGEIRV